MTRFMNLQPIMTVPMIILSVLSVVGGFIGSFALFGDETLHPFVTFLNPVFTNPAWTNVPITIPVGSLPIEWLSTVLSVGIALVGIFVAWSLYRNGFFYKENKNSLYQFVLHKYYVDEFLIAVVIQPALWIGRTSTRLLERDALDGGSRSLGKLFLGMSKGTTSTTNRICTELCFSNHDWSFVDYRLLCGEGVEACFHCYR